MMRTVKWLFLMVLILVLGAVGAFISEHYLLPKLSVDSFWNRFGFVKKSAETTTIINTTQQVTVREDDSVEKISTQAAGTVVNIVSVANDKTIKTGVVAPSAAALTGSGVILTNDGIIATYRTALIESGASYTVLLANGASHPATLVGIDPLTNLAFLRVEASGLPAIAFADSRDMRSGKKLILLANSSEEYQNRFSLSLLSDVNKSLNLSGKTVALSEKWEGVFDIDEGSSPERYLGGPAIDFNGELVGIMGNSLLDNQTSYFLLPSNAVHKALDRIMDGALAKRPVLGVYYVTITKIYALTHNLNQDRGALVFAPPIASHPGAAVIDGSPAAAAGVRAGDIIISVNNQDIDLDNPLSVAIGAFNPGDTVTLGIIREGKSQNLVVKL